MTLRIEFTRALDSSAFYPEAMSGWQELGSHEEADYRSYDELKIHLLKLMQNNWGGARDYAIRVRNINTDFVHMQWEPTCSLLATSGIYPRIEWREPTPPNPGDLKNMVKVTIRRVAGKLSLLVDAKDFHTQLDEIGCTHDGARYNDRPAAGNTVANSSFQLSTEVLLRREYRDIEVQERKKTDSGVETVTVKVPTTACVDLSSVWTNPPSLDQLKKLCNSTKDAARKILEHYQPIDISVEIHKKVVK